MNYLCCDPLHDRDSDSEGSITCSTDEGILECDYDSQVTKLYKSIEERQWEEVLYFLETGRWYNTSIFSVFGDQDDGPSIQARTWVTALDDIGNVRWCQLPLHAAVTFLAPFSIIEKLVKVYPKSTRCADDQDMLPLHYAFRFGANDDILAYLLEQFPQAIGKAAVKDRLPLDLAQYGPRPDRRTIIDYYMQSAVRNAKREWDGEYEQITSSMKDKADLELCQELSSKKTKLEMVLRELELARQELQLLKTEKPYPDGTEVDTANKSTRTRKSLKSAKSSRPTKSFQNKEKTSKRHIEIAETYQKPSLSQLETSRTNAADDSTSARTGFSKLFGKRNK